SKDCPYRCTTETNVALITLALGGHGADAAECPLSQSRHPLAALARVPDPLGTEEEAELPPEKRST
ncbi:MAG: hypothetical protein WAK55_06425, partial [Xanthobacteraceae bacterium]